MKYKTALLLTTVSERYTNIIENTSYSNRTKRRGFPKSRRSSTLSADLGEGNTGETDNVLWPTFIWQVFIVR